MKKKKLILELILSCVNFFVLLFPIQEDKVTLISLEGKTLKDDLFIIKNNLPKEYRVTEVLYHFKKNDIIHSIGYLCNSISQIWHINRSKLVLINDNNFVISRFKRPGVTVIQVWHANGAIKKFGNCLDRKYQIANYDYILANSEYWKGPYEKAFGVSAENILVTGLPKLDRLIDEEKMDKLKEGILEKYPQCKDKKVILYAPTFRGNIYEGVKPADIDFKKVLNGIEDECIILYKPHPLLVGKKISDYVNLIEVAEEELYALFAISDILISDYSSIIFDYSMINKPICLFVPDIVEYKKNIGLFVEYEELPGYLCNNELELHSAIIKSNDCIKEISNKEFEKEYIYHRDGNNTKRVMEIIKSIMEVKKMEMQ